MWILVDARIASQDGCEFRLAPIDSAVTTGNEGRIPQRCIVFLWKGDVTMLFMGDILKETPEIAKKRRRARTAVTLPPADVIVSARTQLGSKSHNPVIYENAIGQARR